MFYLDFLAETHRRLKPAAYLEIGVDVGHSLALAGCPSIGVDPDFRIEAELDQRVALFRTLSDEYFSRPDPLAPTDGVPFDLSFVDGLHLFEFALRDFIVAERYSSASGVVILDDVLPRTVDESARERHTVAWTGDVFRVVEVLARYRPELMLLPFDTSPTGMLMVLGLDPTSTVLVDHYDEIMAEFRRPDPQDVPAEILDRTSVIGSARFLRSGLLEVLRDLPSPATHAEVSEVIPQLVANRLGRGFVTSAAAVA
jgi:hypothetical protein